MSFSWHNTHVFFLSIMNGPNRPGWFRRWIHSKRETAPSYSRYVFFRTTTPMSSSSADWISCIYIHIYIFRCHKHRPFLWAQHSRLIGPFRCHKHRLFLWAQHSRLIGPFRCHKHRLFLWAHRSRLIGPFRCHGHRAFSFRFSAPDTQLCTENTHPTQHKIRYASDLQYRQIRDRNDAVRGLVFGVY